MPFFTFKTLALAALGSALMLGAASLFGQVGPTAPAKFDAAMLALASTGTLIYRGDTFAQNSTSPVPLFRYERRVQSSPAGLTASHITSDPTGRVVIVESSQMAPSYEVQRFDVQNLQAGYAGSVVVSKAGHHLEYALNHQGTLSTASEDVSDPLVSGPSMFGYILTHWDALKGGTALPVRMIVMKEKTTYGFDLKFEKSGNGQTSFTIIPSNFLIRMAIAPLRVVFDTDSRTAVRYEGRVPPMENISGKLKDLDARVEYTTVASAYR